MASARQLLVAGLLALGSIGAQQEPAVAAPQRFERVLWCAEGGEGAALARGSGYTAVQLGRGGDPTPIRSAGLRFYLDQPIGKGLPGPSLLAYVITSKLGDHLPLYRLERIFERQHVHIARSTMCAWMRFAGELVIPLTELMTERVRQSQAIHTDDTPVPIQSPGAKQCRKGRVWCYLGDDANPYIVYDYTPNRSRDGPAK